jgi:hypothetical protein
VHTANSESIEKSTYGLSEGRQHVTARVGYRKHPYDWDGQEWALPSPSLSGIRWRVRDVRNEGRSGLFFFYQTACRFYVEDWELRIASGNSSLMLTLVFKSLGEGCNRLFTRGLGPAGAGSSAPGGVGPCYLDPLGPYEPGYSLSTEPTDAAASAHH